MTSVTSITCKFAHFDSSILFLYVYRLLKDTRYKIIFVGISNVSNSLILLDQVIQWTFYSSFVSGLFCICLYLISFSIIKTNIEIYFLGKEIYFYIFLVSPIIS